MVQDSKTMTYYEEIEKRNKKAMSTPDFRDNLKGLGNEIDKMEKRKEKEKKEMEESETFNLFDEKK